MLWSDAVVKIESNIAAAVKRAKREGITGMSINNLKMVTPSVSMANGNAYMRAFDEALQNLRGKSALKGFELYD